MQVLVDGEWGTVCDDGWDADDAAVACRQLGFSADGAQALSSSPNSDQLQSYFGGNDAIRINMANVGCWGSGLLGESTLQGCAFNRIWQNEHCSHDDDAGVHCQPKIRLVGGATPNEGRVEVKNNACMCAHGCLSASPAPACLLAPAIVNHPKMVSLFHYDMQVLVDGEWGTVCDDDWDAGDAAVACRQLGFPADGAQALTLAFFGGNDAIRINMASVGCMGAEASLHDCAFVTWQNHRTWDRCAHWEDAGVRCKGMPTFAGARWCSLPHACRRLALRACS
jgi:hypothetical protein